MTIATLTRDLAREPARISPSLGRRMIERAFAKAEKPLSDERLQSSLSRLARATLADARGELRPELADARGGEPTGYFTTATLRKSSRARKPVTR